MRLRRIVVRCQSVGLSLALGAAAAFAHAGNEIYRCMDGPRITYTDRSCGEQGSIVAVGPLATLSSAVHGDASAGYPANSPLALGMSPRSVHQAMGRPIDTVATLEGRTLVEYWRYRGSGGTIRVAFEDGRVTRISAN